MKYFFGFPFLLVAQRVKCLLAMQETSFGGSEGKVSACHARDLGSIPRSGRSPGEGNGNPFQYSCLDKSMDGGA